jgi:MFS family permease
LAQDITKNQTLNKPKFFYGYIIVIASFLIMTTIFGSYLSYGIFLKPVLTEFGWSSAILSGAFSVSMIIHGALGIIMGGMADRLGPRRVVFLCGAFLGLGYILMSTVGSIWQLYLYFGVGIGIGVSGAWVAIISNISHWFVTRRSAMMGIVMAGSGLGTLIVAPGANWLIDAYSWRTAFIVLGVVSMIIVLGAGLLLEKDPAKKGLLPYGIQSNSKSKSSDLPRIKGLTLKQAIKTRAFWMITFALIAFGFSMLVVTIHIVPNVIDNGFSTANAALVLAIIGGSGIAGRLLAGVVADKIGSKPNFIIGFGIMALSIFFLIIASELWMFVLFAVVFGFGQGEMAVSEAPLIASLFGLREHGAILGLADFGFTFGASIGPLIAGYIFDFSQSYRWAFFVAALVGILGLILIASVKSTTKNSI